MILLSFSFFFFQAEDGIRDIGVTGVKTCALPISRVSFGARTVGPGRAPSRPAGSPARDLRAQAHAGNGAGSLERSRREIGRASCRERVEITGVAGIEREEKSSWRDT